MAIDATLSGTSGMWTKKDRPVCEKDGKEFKKQFKPNELPTQHAKYTHNKKDYLPCVGGEKKTQAGT